MFCIAWVGVDSTLSDPAYPLSITFCRRCDTWRKKLEAAGMVMYRHVNWSIRILVTNRPVFHETWPHTPPGFSKSRKPEQLGFENLVLVDWNLVKPNPTPGRQIRWALKSMRQCARSLANTHWTLPIVPTSHDTEQNWERMICCARTTMRHTLEPLCSKMISTTAKNKHDAHLVNARCNSNHYAVTKDFAVFAERFLRLQFGLVMDMKPIPFCRHLKQEWF